MLRVEVNQRFFSCSILIATDGFAQFAINVSFDARFYPGLQSSAAEELEAYRKGCRSLNSARCSSKRDGTASAS